MENNFQLALLPKLGMVFVPLGGFLFGEAISNLVNWSNPSAVAGVSACLASLVLFALRSIFRERRDTFALMERIRQDMAGHYDKIISDQRDFYEKQLNDPPQKPGKLPQ